MRRVLLVLLVAGTMAAASTTAGAMVRVSDGVPAGTATAAGLRDCGGIRGSADAPKAIRVAGMSCRRGTALAEAHWLVSGRFDACAARRSSCVLRGFACRRSGTRRRAVRCSRGAKQVRFRYAS